MAIKRNIFLLLCLFLSVIVSAQEAEKHKISADFTAQGVVGYNLTYKWYGGADLKGVLHFDDTDIALALESLTENVHSMGVTVGQSFKVCDNGFVIVDGTLHSRIFANYKTYEFVYAGSVGFRMRHFLVQAGVFSRTIDAFGRSWHSVDNYVTEPFNLLYKVKLLLKGNENPWDIYCVFSNYNDFEYERMWEPIFSLGGRWDFKEKWSAVAEGTLEAAGLFHGTVKFYEAILRFGVVYKL